MEEETQESLWSKKANDITVGDAMKLNAIVLAVMAGCVVVPYACIAGYEAVGSKIRKFRENHPKKSKFEVVK